MHPKITAEVVQAYLNCPYKAHLKLGGQTACDADYARMQAEIRQTAIQHWHEQSAEAYPLKQVEQNVRISPELLSRGFELLLDPVFEDEDFELHGEGIARVAGRSKLGSFHYVPVLVCERRALLKADKLQLALWAELLAPLQGKFADMGHIFQGSRNRATKVRLSKLKRDAEELISNLRQLRAAAPPPLILNDHCSTCGFRQRCRTEALDNDNLTLLRGIGPKEIKKYHRKGILTLTQLSHTFRPRRKGKRGSPCIGLTSQA